MGNSAQVAGLIRHIATLIGGILVAVGWLNQDDLTGITEALVLVSGGIISIVGIVASWKSPSKQK